MPSPITEGQFHNISALRELNEKHTINNMKHDQKHTTTITVTVATFAIIMGYSSAVALNARSNAATFPAWQTPLPKSKNSGAK
jgi:hypothetical protein